MKTRIPDRWLPYQSLGQRIPGTRFISFKVPLTDGAFNQMPDDIKFTPEILMEQCPTLQFIVDLTNTHRYYNRKVFTDRGLHYKKILTPGHVIPGENYVKEFFDTVDAFLSMPAEPDSLIGVHCTHGLNRTSYFICCYMIHRMGFEPKDAIEAFEEARGHKIERNLYVEDLLKGGMGSKENEGPDEWPVHHRPSPYERPAGRDRRRRRSRWDNSAPAPHRAPGPAPYANQAPHRAPGPAQYENPYARSRGGPNGRFPQHNHNPHNNSEKTSGYANYGRPAPAYPPPSYTEYPVHRGGQQASSGPVHRGGQQASSGPVHRGGQQASSGPIRRGRQPGPTPYNARLQARGRAGANNRRQL